MNLKILLIPIALLSVTAYYLYSSILPYKFSQQDQLEINNLTGAFDNTDLLGRFHNITAQSGLIESAIASTNVLGEENGEESAEKRIEIDLTNQRLYAFEGDEKVYDFIISSGKWGKTPTGEFKIWIKLKYTKMSGGSRALGTYYYLPNVPYVMYFYNDEIPQARGYGIHGTYWHDNFGVPMSHGCINLRTEDAEKLYYWANPELGDAASIRATSDNPGTKIIIYGKYEG